MRIPFLVCVFCASSVSVSAFAQEAPAQVAARQVGLIQVTAEAPTPPATPSRLVCDGRSIDLCATLARVEALLTQPTALAARPAVRRPGVAARPAVRRPGVRPAVVAQPACAPGDEACLCTRRGGLMIADDSGSAPRCRVGAEVVQALMPRVRALEIATAGNGRRLAEFASVAPSLIIEAAVCQAGAATPAMGYHCDTVAARLAAAQAATVVPTATPSP